MVFEGGGHLLQKLELGLEHELERCEDGKPSQPENSVPDVWRHFVKQPWSATRREGESKALTVMEGWWDASIEQTITGRGAVWFGDSMAPQLAASIRQRLSADREEERVRHRDRGQMPLPIAAERPIFSCT